MRNPHERYVFALRWSPLSLLPSSRFARALTEPSFSYLSRNSITKDIFLDKVLQLSDEFSHAVPGRRLSFELLLKSEGNISRVFDVRI